MMTRNVTRTLINSDPVMTDPHSFFCSRVQRGTRRKVPHEELATNCASSRRQIVLKITTLVLMAGVTAAAAGDPAPQDLARDLAPTGTLRATYIATNPVQAFVDPATGVTRGPAAAITAALGKRAGVPFTITGAKG